MTDVTQVNSAKDEAESPAPALEEGVTEIEKEAPIAEQLGLVTDSVAFSTIDDLLQFKKVKYTSNCHSLEKT